MDHKNPVKRFNGQMQVLNLDLYVAIQLELF